MDQKRDSFFTVILMPRGVRGKYTTLALSKKNIQIILTVSGVMLFLLLFVLVDYASVKRKAFFAKKYEVENKSQAQKIALLEGGMKDLQGQLQRFENYKRKLNIIAGLESPMALKEVGSGGSSINPTGLGVTIPRNTLAPAVSPKEVSVPGKISSLKSKAAGIEKNLDFLYKFFREQEKTLASSPSIWPTKGIITSNYSWRKDPFTGSREFHAGIDIATQTGNRVIVSADGLVIQSTFRKDYGNYIIVLHNNGTKTLYAHLKSCLVKPGARVTRGQSIGLVGSTGKSTAPHLHYEVLVNNKPINPMDYILENDFLPEE